MQRSSGHRVSDLFIQALSFAPDARSAFLDRACNGDGALRRDVESLLDADRDAGDFLHRPLMDGAVVLPEIDEHASWVGRRVGRYRIEDLIATGGMGAVYRAVRADDQYEQRVAIKIIRRGVVNELTRRRFRAERQTLAQLQHPNITRLLDGGTTDDDTPFLVMEFVEGRLIDEHCDERRLGIEERLRLFVKVCDAVQFAHQNLVIHRDLKPRNILVTPDGDPKLLDFGIAKLLDAPGGREVTATMLRLLTPRYASPEQVRGDRQTTASDIYSLGVILYELLTGHRPYDLDDRSDYEQGRIVCEQDPATPSAIVTRDTSIVLRKGSTERVTAAMVGALRGERPDRLRRRLRGDLDNIVMMAMQKDPSRRYASVQQLREDIGRYLDGLPVIARKDTFRYRTAKFVRRHRGGVIAAAMVLFVLLAGMVGTGVGLVRARESERIAQRERNAALLARDDADEIVRFMQRTLGAGNPYREGREVGVVELLQDAAERIDTEFADRPRVEAGVRCAIAKTLAGMWRWADAVPHLERALAIYRSSESADVGPLTECMSILGRGKTFLRDPSAVALQRETLRLREEHFGREHRLVAESHATLGFALWHAALPPAWDEAEIGYREALDIYDSLGLRLHPDVARVTFSLAVMLGNIERYDESLALFDEAVAIYRELPETEDRYRVECLKKYGRILRAAGRSDEAEEFLLEARSLTPREYVHDGEDVTTWLLAAVKRESGDYLGAEKLLVDDVADLCRMNADRPGSGSAGLRRVAQALTDTPVREMSARHYVAALEALLAADVDGRDIDIVTAGLIEVAKLRRATLDVAGTEYILRSVIDALSESDRLSSQRIAAARGLLGEILATRGRFAEAEDHLLSSYEFAAGDMGERHALTRMARKRLVRLYDWWGQPDQADSYR